MPTADGPGEEINATITGDVSGQVAVGSGISQHRTVDGTPEGESPEDALRRAFTGLEARVAAEAPPAVTTGALGRLEELRVAVTSAPPDLVTVEYVQEWFAANLPELGGAVSEALSLPAVRALLPPR
jgi:hypothetical protein